MPVSETVTTAEVAEICYSAPVTNAWPERGASAVKQIKTRYMP